MRRIPLLLKYIGMNLIVPFSGLGIMISHIARKSHMKVIACRMALYQIRYVAPVPAVYLHCYLLINTLVVPKISHNDLFSKVRLLGFSKRPV